MIKILKIGKSYISFDDEAKNLCAKSFFGNLEENKVLYEAVEALYLAEKNTAGIFKKNKKIDVKEFIEKMNENEFSEYIVYKDLRKKGHILKSGTKFGGNFIVYDKGITPKTGHSKWVCTIIKKGKSINIDSIIKKSRIAHSTAKTLLLAVIEENKPLYYELKWKKI